MVPLKFQIIIMHTNSSNMLLDPSQNRQIMWVWGEGMDTRGSLGRKGGVYLPWW